jgi:hypothetical protein
MAGLNVRSVTCGELKNDGEEIMIGSEIFQVVYCVKRNRVGLRRFDPAWWQQWFLLKCPVVGMGSVAEARQLIKEQKQVLGSRFQPVIIGETNGDFEGMDCDSLFGVHAIGGLDACELEFPVELLEKDE